MRHQLTALLTGILLLPTLVSAGASRDDDGRSRVDILQLSGDLRAHDPALVRNESSGEWFVFSTGDPLVAGGNIQIRRSTDLHNWTYGGTVFDAIPAWILTSIPGVTSLWAPEIRLHDGTYYLYYAASTFGSNHSIIALATSKTLEPGSWVDQGLVVESQPTNDFNAIDPAVVEDRNGTPYLGFGSFWSGIRMFQLQWPSGMLAPGQGQPLRLADRFVPPNALEAAAFKYHDGWYYLFVSFDFCCQGTNSTYKIVVGRSRSPTGPYFDELGTPLEHGGGTTLLSEQGTQFGPGGESIFGDLIAYHFYDGTANGDFRLSIRRINWSDDGWPVIANPVPGL